MDSLYHMIAVGVTAMVMIVIFKLLLTKYPIPGLSDIAAMA